MVFIAFFFLKKGKKSDTPNSCVIYNLSLLHFTLRFAFFFSHLVTKWSFRSRVVKLHADCCYDTERDSNVAFKMKNLPKAVAELKVQGYNN